MPSPRSAVSNCEGKAMRNVLRGPDDRCGGYPSPKVTSAALMSGAPSVHIASLHHSRAVGKEPTGAVTKDE